MLSNIASTCVWTSTKPLALFCSSFLHGAQGTSSVQTHSHLYGISYKVFTFTPPVSTFGPWPTTFFEFKCFLSCLFLKLLAGSLRWSSWSGSLTSLFTRTFPKDPKTAVALYASWGFRAVGCSLKKTHKLTLLHLLQLRPSSSKGRNKDISHSEIGYFSLG